MNIPSDAELLEAIDKFLARHDMAPTRFGSLATGEPQLLKSIREGRSPSLRVLQRLKAFMADRDAELDGAADHVAPDTQNGSSANTGKPGDVTGRDVSGVAA